MGSQTSGVFAFTLDELSSSIQTTTAIYLDPNIRDQYSVWLVLTIGALSLLSLSQQIEKNESFSPTIAKTNKLKKHYKKSTEKKENNHSQKSFEPKNFSGNLISKKNSKKIVQTDG